MKEEIAAIGSTSSNPLVRTEQAYLIASDFCSKVKASDVFDTQESEIEFFKKIRPGFEAELIYFGELYYLISSLPEGKKNRIKYLESQYVPIMMYRRRYQSLYEYWCLDRSDLDQQLFARQGLKDFIFFSRPLPHGDSNSLPVGKVFARFRAYQELHGYLQKELGKLSNKGVNGINHSIRWTATKAALVELAYALKASGAINNGNASIRDIATHLENAFHQDLSQFYRTFQEIRIRKNSRTTFLDRLKDKLERWMDNTDLNSRGDI